MSETVAPDPGRARRVAAFVLKDVNAAIREFEMIRAGDRIAVALSGGKDSLGLLRLLMLRRGLVAEPYELAAIHVRGDASGITEPHAALETWLAAQPGIVYRIVEPALTPGDTVPLACQRCTWLRRKALFMAGEDLGCNVVAFAHHADDAAQTTLMNIIYSGSPHTLAPCADYFDGRFRLIRPLLYVPESELARLAAAEGYPAPPPACPRAPSSRRLVARQMLHMLGRDYLKQGRINLIRTGLQHIDAPRARRPRP